MSGDVAEEGGLLSLGPGKVLFIFRTEIGDVNECVSLDDGKTWDPRPARLFPAHPFQVPNQFMHIVPICVAVRKRLR